MVLLASADALALADLADALSSGGHDGFALAMTASDLVAAARSGRYSIAIVDCRLLLDNPGSETSLERRGMRLRLVGGRFAAGAIMELEAEGIRVSGPHPVARATGALRGLIAAAWNAARRFMRAAPSHGGTRGSDPLSALVT